MSPAVLQAAVLPLAFLLDFLVGDPRWLPHPVRLIGRVAGVLEKTALSLAKHPLGQRLAGGALVFLVAAGSFFLTRLLLAAAYGGHPLLGFLFAAYVLYAMLAVKDMITHIRPVLEALERENLPLARERVSWLVSRDTGSLDEEGVLRASLESLFENTADGVVAPLFYAGLGGPALAVLYKAVNTLDSMIGYKNERYYYLGWAAARLDDLLSFIPARLTALLYLFSGALFGKRKGQWKDAWRVLQRDRHKHESPNSAWPVAAAAAVLGVRLGGVDEHQGIRISRPLLHQEGRPPGRADLSAGLELFRRCCWLSAGGATLLSLLTAASLGVLF